MEALSNTFHQVVNILSSFLGFELFNLGGTPISASSLVKILFAIILALWISGFFRRAIVKLSKHNASFKEETAYALGRVTHYIIIAIGFFVGLTSVGIQLTNITIIAGALGVGIGFGLQSIFSNFVSGLIILFERNFKVSDYVVLQSGVEGVVKEINVRSTRITTNDNLDIIVPNSEFITAQVTNWTLYDRIIRIHIPFGVSYNSDKETVKKAAIEAALNVPFTLNEEKREPLVWLVNFGDNSLDFELVVWVDTRGVGRPGSVRATYNWELHSSLLKHNIEIPFPQRDIHIKTSSSN